MSQDLINTADILVQAGRPDKIEGRHVNMPVELGSTMVFDTLGAFEAARDARYESGTLYYGRYGNSATTKLEQAIARLEGADAVTLTSSGVAAITTSLMTFTKPGAHVLVADHVYGNTRTFCDGLLTRQGVEISYFDPLIGSGITDLIRPNTVAIMFEAPGSGTFEVPDIPAIAMAAKAAGVVTILDNTWSTPLFCQPLSLGVDVVVYSGSKYLSGHSDCMLGVTATTLKHHMAIRQTIMQIGDKTGGQEIMLALRGLRTLKVRMEYFDRVGREMAQWFLERPEVKTILHPAFETCPGHANWKRDFSGAASLFSVILKPCDTIRMRAFVNALHHFGIGVSWGGYESLVLPVEPVRTATAWEEEGHLIRFNIGMEDPESLKADLAQAMQHLSS
ncbi:cystathionine beta-lyase [Epibacterium ulvae]|uniref:Cystathionine beta-lyase n=1 Tax=Epibacterium ulvae TaxID=1156985 RepID=A0A1G5QSF6_9RHOB|nr:cystathionine beta-lyase [Epibacterium ulvae]SCZ64508.1 cystathionine beta-lyase [Epibacterium ulvae]